MYILPNSAKQFNDPCFWRKFFEKQKQPFECFFQLYDVGYRHITSIDTDEKIIEKQLNDNNGIRPELKFLCCSAMKVDIETECINVVLDKGTLDALLPPDCSEIDIAEVERMFTEIDRILIVGGRYLVVTLAQSHLLKILLKSFVARSNYLFRIQKVDGMNKKSKLPVFIIIITKLRSPLSSNIFEYIKADSGKACRLSSLEALQSVINSEQELAFFEYLCSKKLSEEVAILIYNDAGEVRYQISIVDNQKIHFPLTYAVFIVPIGREHEWLFGTEKGRMDLREKCLTDRLAVIFLSREQQYEDLEFIKKELDSFILKFAPPKLRHGHSRINYLSIGEYDVKKTVAKGNSSINGTWTVEDVEINGSLFRQLIFLSSRHLVQSQARLIKRKKSTIVDLDKLMCEHHNAMLIAFLFLSRQVLCSPQEATLRCFWQKSFIDRSAELEMILEKEDSYSQIVLGLGGGLLPSFLLRQFLKSSISVVEIDPSVKDIAEQYFSLPVDNPNLSIIIDDALNFIFQAQNKLLYDVLFVDIAGSMNVEGLNCPPPSFITAEVLTSMHNLLKPNGVMAFNFVTRDDAYGNEIIEKIKSVFGNVYIYSSNEDINKVLICPKENIDIASANKISKSLRRENDWRSNLAEEMCHLSIY
ncbi:unnamed protein product [Dracunculus medinensis]|uniref:Methyltransf_11 domain-containing protein n=1 Tax=Dracunculus medinensis TaxID=318479 RepID=A0A0N4U6Q0_DRAME|nr:unnamed protein product [Dracunculus medinensis]